MNERYGSAGDPAKEGVDELVRKIGAQLGAVEEVVSFGDRFEGVLIVKVVSCEAHPNADRLHICKVDDGGKAGDAERDESGLVQVVCGALNVRAGMLAAWLPPGATVPSTFGAKDPFVLEARSLRGVVSNGMLASPKELGLGDSHEGILEIILDPDEHLEPGVTFADAYHLHGDVIIDMENKMFTHRPDCFGWLGIAREIEGIHHRPYKSPEWYRIDPEFPASEAEELSLEVINDLPDLVPRFTAVTLRDVQVRQSPVWLQVELVRAGLRPINNIVDYTNYFMLLTGQPVHAYDYDKVAALSGGNKAKLIVRFPREDEKITLLNGKEIEPRPDAIVIATDTHLLGLGGVMGGADTEVDENTKNIIIECATFDMYAIRRTAMAHGVFTDAVARFNKGQSPLQNKAVATRLVDEIRRFAAGKVASPFIDIRHVPEEARARGNIHAPVRVTAGFVNDRLGFNLSADEMRTLLTNVECSVEQNGGDLTVTAPFWRTDIAIPEDVVEEIGRLYGYDRLPLVLPKRDLTPSPKNPMLELQKRLRTALTHAGANELLTYTFVHGDLLDKTGQNRDLAFRLSNALSPDLQYYRLSLTPSLLEKNHLNIKAGYDEFVLFEIGKAHAKHDAEDGDGLPKETPLLALVMTANGKSAAERQGAPFYEARRYLDFLARELGVTLAYTAVDTEPDAQLTKPFDPARSALVGVQGTDVTLGILGEYRPAVLQRLKLPRFTAGFEISLEELLKVSKAARPYVQLPRFPRVEQDLCLKVPAATPYARVFQFVDDTISKQCPDATFHTLAPVDIYQRQDDTVYKQITLRLSIASYERTLTDHEVNALLDTVASAAKEHLHAERV
ncbi:MAG TPA: phenylalanine--tRNA ligase subunit beta [Candidatus Saccharimonadales bacterium]|nr:phenylalanine--tRNA ligase subunit beta [Candidatus Saccharimonadales bacterium]